MIKKLLNPVLEYLQKIGKSLMLPVAVLPAAAILMGIGYWINPSYGQQHNVFAHFLFQSGAAIIDNMALLFAAGVAYGLSRDRDGGAVIGGVIAFLVFVTLLSTQSVSLILNQNISNVHPAFDRINNQFIGILAGIIGGHSYNRFSKVELTKILAFFSGKRLVPIMASFIAMAVSLILLFIWPFVYGSLISFGVAISNLGIFGVGIYGFSTRMLIPFGLHHALNSVFWFDGFGIADLQNFFSAGQGVVGVTGRYMAGFFPIMMFGLPGAALAMIHTAKKENRHKVTAILVAAGFTSFFTGVTEPIEFSFLFVAPLLLVVHALFTGLSMMIAAAIPALSGFGFSAGVIDFILSARNQYAINFWILPLIGLGFGVLYYVTFRFLIVTLNLKTFGRGDDPIIESLKPNETSNHHKVAQEMLLALGGSKNIVELDNCITRLRLIVDDSKLINDQRLKELGALSVIKSNESIQVVIGPHVQFIANEMRVLL